MLTRLIRLVSGEPADTTGPTTTTAALTGRSLETTGVPPTLQPGPEQVPIGAEAPLPFWNSPSGGEKPEESPGSEEQGPPLEIEVFEREPEGTSGPTDDLYSAEGPVEGSPDSLSLLLDSRESKRESFSESEIQKAPTLDQPISPSTPSNRSIPVSAIDRSVPAIDIRSLQELRSLLHPELLERALHEVERGTAVGLVVREMRDLGISVPSKQVRALRAPDKSLALVEEWISGASALKTHRPREYLRWLQALLAGEALPHLPPSSRLKEIRRHVAGVGPGSERERLIDDVLTTRFRKRQRTTLARLRYPSDPIGRRALVQVDKRIDHTRSAPTELRELFERARERLVPIDDARARLQRLRALLLDTAEMAQMFEAALSDLHDHHQDDPT
ncbi:MAG: hypothetical protein KIT84_00595 [Labilithrix sp.]|nr:hypothetical protein [Labilithrix sp.]MCW5809482.1 hypothetical protein [Labilithrix sp.]